MGPTSRGWSRRPPDITLAELKAELERRFGIVAGLSTIHKALHRLGLMHKKVLESAEQDRPGQIRGTTRHHREGLLERRLPR